MNLFKKFFLGLRIVPKSTSTADEQGELEVDSATGRLKFHDGANLEKVVTDASTDTLTNKTIDADGTGNVISNIDDGNIKTGANIAVAKLAALTANRAVQSDGSGVLSPSSVTNTELGHLSGVTSSVQTQLTGKVNKAGDTMSGVLDMGANAVTSSFAPLGANDLANKAYVDSVAQGLDVKDSVKVATNSAGTLATSFENGDTVDGVVLTTGDRILIKNQAAPAENGIYIVAASGAPSRSSDANSWFKLTSAFVFVEQGTTGSDTGWVCTINSGGTLGTTPVTFVQFSGVGTITTDGQGVEISGNQISLELNGGSLVKGASGLKVSGILEHLDNIYGAGIVIDSTTTGSAQTLTFPDAVSMKVSNVGLVSVTGMTWTGVPEYLVLTNDTGNSITILNDQGTADERILTGTGQDLILTNNASLYLYYDNYTSKWRVVGGSGGSGRVVTNTFVLPTIVTAGGGITAMGGTDQDNYVASSSGEVNVTANPQVSAGTLDGQTLRLIGTSDTAYIVLEDGTGLSLNGEWLSYSGSTLTLRWDSSSALWREVSRSDL